MNNNQLKKKKIETKPKEMNVNFFVRSTFCAAFRSPSQPNADIVHISRHEHETKLCTVFSLLAFYFSLAADVTLLHAAVRV